MSVRLTYNSGALSRWGRSSGVLPDESERDSCTVTFCVRHEHVALSGGKLSREGYQADAPWVT